MSVGIAFEGCGCRAAFHVGVIEWLTERGFTPTAVAGASSGSLVAAATAVGKLEELRPAWMRLLGTRVFQWRRMLTLRWPFVMTQIVGGASRTHFGEACVADTDVPLSIVVTQWRRRRWVPYFITPYDRVPIVRAILASCFIPGPYSRLFTIDRRPCFDGAWLTSVPIDAAHRAGAARVIACVADDHGRILGGVRRRPVNAPKSDHRILSPVKPLPLRTFDFDGERTRACFAIGRASAAQFAKANEQWLS